MELFLVAVALKIVFALNPGSHERLGHLPPLPARAHGVVDEREKVLKDLENNRRKHDEVVKTFLETQRLMDENKKRVQQLDKQVRDLELRFERLIKSVSDERVPPSARKTPMSISLLRRLSTIIGSVAGIH